jgi:hypothetical protein
MIFKILKFTSSFINIVDQFESQINLRTVSGVNESAEVSIFVSIRFATGISNFFFSKKMQTFPLFHAFLFFISNFNS